MATSKAKRPILLAQARRRRSHPTTNSQAKNKTKAAITDLMPVKAYVYRAVAEMNGRFEKVAQELATLAQISFFRRERVTAMRELICHLRAEANRDFTVAMHERERANAGHLERQTIRAAHHARVA